ncbi:MAG: redoxin domain-containing protein [Candidatus Heimdallarchaeota archaeon]|nr:redoxin domain-containing protein [Candidatus Heimdallarchaeota archaeon]
MAEENTKLKQSKKWLKVVAITLSLVVVLSGIGYGIYYFVSNRRSEPAQDFSVMTLTNKNFTLSNYRGKVVLLDFMSVSCTPCQELMPELATIRNHFNESLVMLSIDVDLTDTVAQLLNFSSKYNATWEFAFDTDNLQEKYGVLQIPKTVVIDQNGFITFAETGFQAGGSKLEEIIQKTLEGKAEPIFTATFGVSIGAAFIAGFLSFFSPCAFPLLPGYMAYNLDLMVRSDDKEKAEENTRFQSQKGRFWKSLIWGSASGLGIFLFYMIIGIVISVLVLAYDKSLENLDKIAEISEYIQLSVGLLLIILGILSFTPISLDMSKIIIKIETASQRRKERRRQRKIAKGLIEDADAAEAMAPEKAPSHFKRWLPQMTQLFIYGITYALASIGCSLPILLSLMLTAFNAGTFAKAISIFIVYSLIMAILMVVITILVGFSKETLITKLQASTKFVKIFTGVLLILAGGFLVGYFLWNRFKI